MSVLEDATLLHDLGNLHLGDVQNPIDELDAATRALDNEALVDRIHPKLPGLDHVLDTLREVIGWPVLYHQEATELGVKWPRGVLLHGPSGTGKTSAVYAVASEYNAIVHLVTAGSIIGSFVGESERRLREIFATAARDAEECGAPVVLFLDDVDSLCPRRGPGQQHEARLVGQLLTLLDGAAAISTNNNNASSSNSIDNRDINTSSSTNKISASKTNSGSRGHVVVIAATSRPNALDPALRRPGRLDREVAVPIPSPHARSQILSSLAAKLPLDPGNVNLELVASQCHGYTGADLEALCREAAMEAISEQILAEIDSEKEEALRQISTSGGGDDHNGGPTTTTTTNNNPAKQLKLITTEDFLQAMHRVGASIARTVVKEFPPASWSDIGGLEETKKKLQQAVEWPITKSEAFKRLGIRSPRGVLLHGPPGCAKTTLARAAASASGATFIPLQGASLYSMYVGEGEAELREAFRKARFAAPSIIFVDELDMLVGKRGGGGGGNSSSSDDTSGRLLSTFLNEMDGLELAGGILVLATTNRPGSIDSALIRPGRFDLTVYVPPPDLTGRIAALQIHSRRIPLASDVDLDKIAGITDNYTGAELEAVCREAAMAALREDVETASEVAMRHFEAAVRGVMPMLSEEMLEMYASWPPRRK